MAPWRLAAMTSHPGSSVEDVSSPALTISAFDDIVSGLRRRVAAVGAATVVVREAAALLGTLAAGGDDYAGRSPEAGGLLAAAAAAAPGPGSAPVAALDEIAAALDWALPEAKARTWLAPARAAPALWQQRPASIMLVAAAAVAPGPSSAPSAALSEVCAALERACA